MANYCKLDTNNIVVQIQPYSESGFVSCPDNVVAGFHYDGTDFTAPPSSHHTHNGTTWVEDLASLKASKVAEIMKAYDAAINDLVSDYPQREIDTFTKQERTRQGRIKQTAEQAHRF